MAEEGWSPWTDQIYQDNRSTLKKNLSPLDMRCELRARSCLADHQLDELEAILKARGKGVHNHTMLQFLELGSLDSFEVFCVAILKVEPKFNFEEVLRRFAPLRERIRDQHTATTQHSAVKPRELVKKEEGVKAERNAAPFPPEQSVGGENTGQAPHRGTNSSAASEETLNWLEVDGIGLACHNASLKFDRQKSFAICVLGISQVVPKDIKYIFVHSLGIPPPNVEVLISPNPNSVRKLLKEKSNSEDVDFLFFYFAGHAASENEIVFTKGNCFTSDTFRNSLLGCKTGLRLVVLLDCCYSGGIAEKFRNSVPEIRNPCIMYACKENEVAWSTPCLGCTMFTYFVKSYLDSQQPEACHGYFPIRETVEHAQVMCPALSALIKMDLVEPNHFSTESNPGVIGPLQGDEEVLASQNDPIITIAFIDSLLESECDGCLPKELKDWFNNTAKTSLGILAQNGYMKKGSGVLQCAVRFMGRSAVWFLNDVSVKNAKNDVNVILRILRLVVVLLEKAGTDDDAKVTMKLVQTDFCERISRIDGYKDVAMSLHEMIRTGKRNSGASPRSECCLS